MLLRMKRLLFAALLLLAPAPLLPGQSYDPEVQIKALCEVHLKTPLPTEAASMPSPRVWPDCVSYRLEAGIGRNVDYAGARKCAWEERQAIQANLKPRYHLAGVLGGAAILSVLYANGEGVERNLPLAGRFVCEAGGSFFDLQALLEELDFMREKPIPPESKFSFCDQTGSGFMQGFCAGLDAEIRDEARVREFRVLSSNLHSLSSPWSQEQRSAFDALVKAEQTYAHAHAKGEINIAGTARAAEQFEAQETLQDEFLAAIKLFEKGMLPKGSASDFAKADADLNRVYRLALADADAKKEEYGAVQPAGIRDAERAWLKYRDAWIVFARLHYPKSSADSWLTLLTKDRADVLKETLCEIGSSDEPCDDETYEQGPSPLP